MWRKQGHPTPVLLPGKSHGRSSQKTNNDPGLGASSIRRQERVLPGQTSIQVKTFTLVLFKCSNVTIALPEPGTSSLQLRRPSSWTSRLAPGVTGHHLSLGSCSPSPGTGDVMRQNCSNRSRGAGLGKTHLGTPDGKGCYKGCCWDIWQTLGNRLSTEGGGGGGHQCQSSKLPGLTACSHLRPCPCHDRCSGLQGHRIKTSQRLSKETITTIHRHWASNSTDLGKPSVKGQIITVLGFVVIMSRSQLSLAMTCNKFRAQKWISMALCQSTLFTEAGGGLDLASRSIGKESACNAGDLSSIPGLGISPGGGHGNPLQYSGLENPHGQRSLVGYTPWSRKRVGRKNKKRGTKDSTAQVPIT